MFWKRPTDTDSDVDALRDYVAQRLRIALEFATLGAYELLEPDVDGADATERADELVRDYSEVRRESPPSPSCGRAGTRRTARPHVSAERVACEREAHGEAEAAEHGSLLEYDDAPACVRARSKSRRAGGVDVPEQPCLWTGA